MEAWSLEYHRRGFNHRKAIGGGGLNVTRNNGVCKHIAICVGEKLIKIIMFTQVVE